ncbi:aspartate/glutamate racemase family protein [Methylobacterium nigriterrae]|uniref:aspartate/glutamate racemase family protein n=1 Tax=Methylobacterium nigriterrae TaxID=3127512 RepID=UPI003013E738
MASQPVRIWYQSFVDEVEQQPYIARLATRLQHLSSPGTIVEVHGISPPDRYFHPLTEFRCADQTIRNALRASEQGFDAFVIGHFQEPGLTECRGTVDIPVVGLGEASLLYGCTLGRKIGLVTIDPVFTPWHEEQIVRHGLERRVAGVTAIQADLPRFMAAFEDPATQAQVREDFVRQVEPLVAVGADVLIPAGGLPMLLFAEQQPFLVHEAVVLEGIATVLKAAEMAVSLHRITGVAASRRGIFARAPAGAIQDFLTPRL